MFWVILLATKLVVSFYVEVLFITDFITILLDMESEYISAFFVEYVRFLGNFIDLRFIP